MWVPSQAALDTLSRSHTAVSRVDVLHGGRAVRTLSVVSGAVSAESGRAVFRNLSSCRIIDPTGEFSGGDIGDILSPYDCEVAPYRGVMLPGGAVELAPLGVFGLTSRSVNGDGSVTIAGQDRALKYQGSMTGSLAISRGTPVEQAIAKLLFTRNNALEMNTWVTGFTCGPLLFNSDIDVWREAQVLAASVGGYLYHDRTGVVTFAPNLPTTGVPAARYAYGDGLLLDATRTEDSDTIHNVVVVESSNANSTPIRVIAEDLDPSSQTYSRGKYGRRVVTKTNPHIYTTRQATQVAATELANELGRSETVAATVVVNPFLDPLDSLVLHHLDAGLNERGVVIASLSTPLSVKDSMSIGMRRSILTRDGQVIAAPEEVKS